MKPRWLVFALLLALALPPGLFSRSRPGSPAATNWQSTSEAIAAPEEAAEIFYVDWNISANGESDVMNGGDRTVTSELIQITGSAVVKKPAQGFLETIPFQTTITDNRYVVESGQCFENHGRWSITDPGRYNGGPDLFWVFPYKFMPLQRGDGSWYMDNPLDDLDFAINGQLGRTFNYRIDYRDLDLCGGQDNIGTSSWEQMYYASILTPLRDKPLEGDLSGTVFSLSDTYNLEYWDPPLTVNFNATVRVGCAASTAIAQAHPEVIQVPNQACSCKNLPAPIDINDPYITGLNVSLEGEDTTPDAGTFVTASVTCEGVPVKNAPLEVSLVVAEDSGGHVHGGPRRPRGSLNHQKITDQNPSIFTTTGSDGQARIFFEPGRDLSGDMHGIAGWYTLKARSTIPRFKNQVAREHIRARLDLNLLPQDDTYMNVSNLDTGHFHGVHFGVETTLDAVQDFALAWTQRQLDHDDDLAFYGKPPWPTVKMKVWAISTKDGGLFDLPLAGWWRMPFYRHNQGTDVLFGFDTNSLSFPVSQAEAQVWLAREFGSLGAEYGSWFNDGGSQYNLAIGRSVSPQALQSPTLDPDVTATAILQDQTGRSVAGTGQTVTYTVGLENLTRSTLASDVLLNASLPAGLNFLSANPPPDYMANAGTPVWDVGSLPAEAIPRVFAVVAQVDPSVAPGSVLTVTTTATTSGPDADPANNQFVTSGLQVQSPGPDLVVASDLEATALVVSAPVSATLMVANDGNTSALSSWIELLVPGGITLTQTTPPASPIPGGVRWNVGTLAPGDMQSVHVVLRVDPSLLDLAALAADDPPYPLSFTLAAGSSATDMDPANNQEQVSRRVVLPGADLLVALKPHGAPGPGVFTVGQEITYTLSYANYGNQTASEANASMLLWPGLAFLGSQPQPASNSLDPSSGVRTLTWNLGDLPTGEYGDIQVLLRFDSVPGTGSILMASAASNSIDINQTNNVEMEIRGANFGNKVCLPISIRSD